MKLSFVTLGCPDWSIEKIVQKAVEYRFDGVELRVMGDKHVDSSLSSGERKTIRNLFKQNKLDVSCLAGYSTFCSDKEEELETNKQLLINNIILAKDLGAPYVRTFIGQHKEGITEDEVIKNAAGYLNYCGDIALKEGVDILVETHDAYCSGTKLKKVFDLIASSGVAVLWDIENNYQQNESPEDFCNVMGEKIKHLHVRDSYKLDNGKFQICLTGKGTVPLKECFEIMDKINYKGYLSFEWEKMWHMELEEPEIAFPQFIEYMKGK